MVVNKALRVCEYSRLPMRSISQGYVFSIEQYPFSYRLFIDLWMELNANLAWQAE